MPELDIARIKRNIGKMIAMGAPESDIDAYVSSEGTTAEALRNASGSLAFEGKSPPSAVDQALSPITSYPETYSRMNRESREQMERGVEQLRSDTGGDLLGSAGAALKGVGNLALGGLGFLSSPLAAGVESIAGKPVENVTGVPKEITNTLVSLGLPLPKRIPLPSRAAEKTAPTVDELKQAYVAAKESPEVAAVRIAPESAAKNADVTVGELTKDWLDPNLAPKTHYILNKLAGGGPEGSTVTMSNVDSARRLLGRMAGRGDEEAAAAAIAKGKLDDWMANVSQADVLAGDPRLAQGIMQEGRANYAAGKLAEALGTKLEKAEHRAASTYSGLNQQNAIRQNVRSFLESDASRGLTDTQRQAAERIVDGTLTQNSLRMLGNILGGGGGLGSVASGAVGGAAMGPAGLALPVAGFAANRLGAALTTRQANKLSELIRSESPLGKQMAGPVEDWNKAAKTAEISPTARNLSRLFIASRNLSTNLKDAGIDVSANELLKSLQDDK